MESSLPKSAALVAAERQLADLEAKIAADKIKREAQHRAKLAAIEQNLSAKEAIQAQRAELAAVAAVAATVPIPATPPTAKPSPVVMMTTTINNVSLPRGKKELTEPCLLLLRDLWLKTCGYNQAQFIDVQMEITSELLEANFARFEREMVCKETLALRSQVNAMVKEKAALMAHKNQLEQQLEEARVEREHAEEAFAVEREHAAEELRAANDMLHHVTLDLQKQSVKVGLLADDVERAERYRLNAVLESDKLKSDNNDLKIANAINSSRANAARGITSAAALANSFVNAGIVPNASIAREAAWQQANDDLKVEELRLRRESANLRAQEVSQMQADLQRDQDLHEMKRIDHERAKMRVRLGLGDELGATPSGVSWGQGMATPKTPKTPRMW